MAAVASSEHQTPIIRHVPVRLIRRNVHQPRKTFHSEELEALTRSVSQHGVLQPILVKPTPGGQYEVIAGERRLRAAIAAGLQTIPAVIRPANGEDSLVLALVENLQRNDMSPVETAHAYKRLVEEFGLSQMEVSTRVGKARATVANTLRLLQLPEEVLQALEQGAITEGHARALLPLDNSLLQISVCRQVISRRLSVRSVEGIGRKSGKPTQADGNISRFAEVLSEKLGAPVEICDGRAGGSITIRYFSDEDLERIADLLGA